MTSEQLGGQVRALIAAVGGYLAGMGYGDDAIWTSAAGLAALIATAAWSYVSKQKA